MQILNGTQKDHTKSLEALLTVSVNQQILGVISTDPTPYPHDQSPTNQSTNGAHAQWPQEAFSCYSRLYSLTVLTPSSSSTQSCSCWERRPLWLLTLLPSFPDPLLVYNSSFTTTSLRPPLANMDANYLKGKYYFSALTWPLSICQQLISSLAPQCCLLWLLLWLCQFSVPSAIVSSWTSYLGCQVPFYSPQGIKNYGP